MQQPRAQLIITLNHDGTINVTGPVQDKLFAYGMLECAKQAIMQQKNPAPQITPVRSLPNFNGGPS